MKSFLIFAAVLGAAHAGGRRLSESESRPFLDGFESLCQSGRVPASGALVDLGGERTWVYCKRAGGRQLHENTEEKTFSVREPPPQAVFVNPPDISLRQRVLVTGTVKAPRTKIFYVPPKVDSSVDVDVHSQTERPQKPTVLFLSKGDDLSSSRSASDRHSRPFDDESADVIRDDDTSRESDLLPEGERQLSRNDVLRLLRREEERRLLSSLSSSDEDRLETAFSDQSRKVSVSQRPKSGNSKSSGFSTLNKRETSSPFTHAIKIDEKQGKSRLLLLRKADK